VSISTLKEFDDCFSCGAARWEPRVDRRGAPYLRCGDCGRAVSMPRQLARRINLRRLPRDAAEVVK